MRTAIAAYGVVASVVLCMITATAVAQDAPAENAEAGPRVAVSLVFAGNEEFHAGTLEKSALVAARHLRESGGSEADAADVAADVAGRYRRAGYPFVITEPQIRPMTPEELATAQEEADDDAPTFESGVVVTIIVMEGPRIEVSDLRFIGQSGIFSIERLRTFFEGLRTGAFGTGPRWYNADRVAGACDGIAGLYRQNGFTDVTVTPPTITPDTPRLPDGTLRLAITIVEGPQSFLREVRITGEPPATDDDLKAVRTRLKRDLGRRVAALERVWPAPPFYRALVPALRSRASAWFKAKGYYQVQVETTITRTGTSVAVHYHIEPGRLFEVGRVEFSGIQTFDRGFLRSIIPLRPETGQQYSLTTDETAYDRLMRTNLILQLNMRTRPRIIPRDGEDAQRLVDYEIEIEEAKSITVTPMIGWGSYEMLRGALDIAERNIFGIGRTVGLLGKLSIKSRSIEARFTDPWTLGIEWPYSIRAEYLRREEPAYTYESYGASISTQHEISARWQFGIRYDFTRVVAFDIDLDANADITDTDNFIGRIEPRLTYDARDGVLDPHKGVLMQLGVGISHGVLGSDANFVKLTGNFVGLAEVVGDALVLAARYKFSSLYAIGRDDLPFVELLHNGGHDSVRSFTEGRLLKPDEVRRDSEGGRLATIFQAEIRHIIVGPLWGAIFFDMGNVLDDYDKWFTPNTFSFGVGYGLRLNTPIGPIRLDLAWNPDRRSDVEQDEFVLHFSIGHPF
jgi:outer membrane protein insertion porin family